MGFYRDVTTRFGTSIAVQMKLLSSNNVKLASALNRRVFLLECKRKHLIPNHISSNIKNIQRLFEMEAGTKFNRKLEKFNEKLIMTILRLEISHANYRINALSKSNRSIMRQISEVVPGEIVNEFRKKQRISYRRHFQRVRQTNIDKINRLQERYNSNIQTQEGWFKNLTDVVIPCGVNTEYSFIIVEEI